MDAWFNCLSSNELAGAVLDVPDGKVESLVGAETRGASRLVADSQVESAGLVDTPVADGVKDVVQLVVLGDEAVGLAQARGDVVHAVGASEGKLAVVHEVRAFASRSVLVLHVDATAHVRLLGSRLAEAKVVPGIVRDVVGTARLINLEEVDTSARVGNLDADVVAANGAGPVGNAVGVDLAAQDTNGGRVLLMGSHADSGSAALERSSRDDSS